MNRLGRLPHNPDRLAAQTHLRLGARRPADRVSRDGLRAPYLGRNDVFGNCTWVAQVNAALRFSEVCGGTDLAVTDDEILTPFKAMAGLPADATDAQIAAVDGLVMLDVMEWQQARGFWVHGKCLTADFRAIAVQDRYSIASAIERFGQVNVGLDLPLAYQTDKVWDTSLPGDHTSGGWGGHDDVFDTYTGLGDTDEVRMLTWGREQWATWRGVEAVLMEAYAQVWRMLLAPGVDYAALLAGVDWAA